MLPTVKLYSLKIQINYYVIIYVQCMVAELIYNLVIGWLICLY